ncbi:MAG: hypothetical protein JJE27_02135 [Thermoleophilia bacterium]|nr:hypothetical protein [Thermoleophilia bacterium]
MNRSRQVLRDRRALLKNEDGFLATLAVVIMTAMMIGGLALLALNQRNNDSLASDRQTQTAYSVAEAGLNDQIKLLSTSWPSSVGTKEPSVCTQLSTSTACPDPATLNANFANTLAAYDNATWAISVRDNVAALATDFQLTNMDTATDATCGTAPCTWDSNADGVLWVVAQAVLQDPTCVARLAAAPTGATTAVSNCARKRTLLAQANINTTLVSVPANSITAGSFSTLNSGNKVMVNETGCSGNGANEICLSKEPAPVAVRCTPPPDTPPPNACLDYIPPKNQVSPAVVKPSQSSDLLISSDQLNMLRTAAKAYGTYYTTCPSTPAGTLVFVELTIYGTCTYNGGTYNSAASPGAFIIANGHVELNANTVFYGLIYALNNHAPTNDTVIMVHGGATVQGALLCEGDGRIAVGETKNALMFDPRAFSTLKGMLNVVMGRNSFRDIPN